MKCSSLVLLSCLAFSQLSAKTPITADGSWPEEIDTGGIHLVISQPRVDSWKDNRIEAICRDRHCLDECTDGHG
jgi:hypothetical protein